ncbi:MAG: chromosome segregation protein [Glaciecola sp.]|jgi:chromosome segregation protein
MRLKKIKLVGFKSFVDATTIPFPGAMTAVVGPNGCGKSNVIDAVRWVLGESSAKNLRGDAMTDVIFNGSTSRKAVSQCSVELIFDNSAGRIAGEYAGYNELSVKRIVTKEAISSYILNGTKCRKRDITDLFLGTGLGPRSYAIIEQGMISKLIESRPQELRIFVEEAAGISKYKERRRETENRIKHTKENLERLEDVRSELGEQLNKLNRQASAANRYKQLKATERELKAQLAVVRWLKQNEQINLANTLILEKETELEEIISRKRGDEFSIIQYREAQESCKLNINEIQQDIFKASTDINKIEQSQVFSKKRKQQIQMELQQLQTQSMQHVELHAETANALVLVQDEVVALEPNKLILDETLEAAQFSRQDAEDTLAKFTNKNKEGEIQFHSLKQKLQSCHGQIQNAMSMQLITEARVKELTQELADIDQEDLEQQSENKQNELLLVSEALSQAKQDFLLMQGRERQAGVKHEKIKAKFELRREQLINLQAQKDALRNIQTESLSNTGIYNKSKVQDEGQFAFVEQLISLPEFIEVQSGYEALLEIVFAHEASPQILKELLIKDIEPDFYLNKQGQSILLEPYMTSKKVRGSLAEKVLNKKVPHFLNSISLVENVEAALIKHKSLGDGKSTLTKCGLWLFQDRLINGASKHVDASLRRAAEITVLSEKIETQQTLLTESSQALNYSVEFTLEIKHLLDDASSLCTDYSEQTFKCSTQLNQLQHNLAQQNARHELLSQELKRKQISKDEEFELLETLNEQVEEGATELAKCEGVIEQQLAESELLKSNVQSARAQVEQLVSETHELALQVQQAKNKYNLLKDKQLTREAQIDDSNERVAMLQEEIEELTMPFDEQQDRLQVLLERKKVLQARQLEIQASLAEINEKLIESEKGRSGINQAVDNIKAEIDRTKLQAEGCRVRAESYMEQLQDMQQPLKPILENLPDAIDENIWQQELEKTTGLLSRLGAVNLAAVEEFELQSEKKRYLDEQNDDLSQALDTLETAIRKIDKETRTRFKATFDQINADLKMLFPKVFGGGSAHLALTEDDMLDTGVTIMARPPGKKNSTIHLLSGGEKALTALSLVFAIFRLNPAPFCLLDEVDAPLDDANVGRFCKLVSEMSRTVQFIYITHNKVAMEMASHLTGVTMAEPGVSRMVAVDVEEALAIAE